MGGSLGGGFSLRMLALYESGLGGAGDLGLAWRGAAFQMSKCGVERQALARCLFWRGAARQALERRLFRRSAARQALARRLFRRGASWRGAAHPCFLHQSRASESVSMAASAKV